MLKLKCSIPHGGGILKRCQTQRESAQFTSSFWVGPETIGKEEKKDRKKKLPESSLQCKVRQGIF